MERKATDRLVTVMWALTMLVLLKLSIKVHFKNQCTRFSNRHCFSIIYQTFLVEKSFQTSDWVELDLWSLVIRMALNVKSQKIKKLCFSPKDRRLQQFEV